MHGYPLVLFKVNVIIEKILRCAEAKIAPIVLKQILGHKDISITMTYYINVDTEFIDSETDNAMQYLVDKNIFELN